MKSVVDSGALQMAINILRRNAKRLIQPTMAEAADELEKSAMRIEVYEELKEKLYSTSYIALLEERDKQLHFIEYHCKVILPDGETVWDLDMLLAAMKKQADEENESYVSIKP